ncbi:hypothetical protein [Mycetohabitans rhizoxinica]
MSTKATCGWSSAIPVRRRRLPVYDRLHLDGLPRRYTIGAGKALFDE